MCVKTKGGHYGRFESRYQSQEVCLNRNISCKKFASREQRAYAWAKIHFFCLLRRHLFCFPPLFYCFFLVTLLCTLLWVLINSCRGFGLSSSFKKNSVPGPAIDFVISYLLYKLSRNLILLPARHILSFTSVGHKRLCAVDQASDGKKQATPKQSAPAATRSAGLLED